MQDRTGQCPPRRVRLGSAVHAGVTEFAEDADGAALWVVLAEERGQPGHAQTLEMARFGLVEDLRAEAATVVRALAHAGLGVQMLFGDRPEAVQRVAAQAGITEARGACTPQDKLAALQSLQAQGHRVAMVGDGLNDCPGWRGPTCHSLLACCSPARSRADFVRLRDSLTQVPQGAPLGAQNLNRLCGKIYGGPLGTTLCVFLWLWWSGCPPGLRDWAWRSACCWWCSMPPAFPRDCQRRRAGAHGDPSPSIFAGSRGFICCRVVISNCGARRWTSFIY